MKTYSIALRVSVAEQNSSDVLHGISERRVTSIA